MREEELKRYFVGEATVDELANELRGSIVELGNLASAVRIADMDGTFELNRHHLIMLCNAINQKHLQAEALSAIAFALLASDAFEWDDEVISEVLSDWSAPEINFELNTETISMHREWLTSSIMPAQYRMAVKAVEGAPRLVSIRSKISR